MGYINDINNLRFTVYCLITAFVIHLFVGHGK